MSTTPTPNDPGAQSNDSTPQELSYIQQALDEMLLVLASKNADYRVSGEFSNFEFASQVAGGQVSTFGVILIQVGIKLGRLNGLLQRTGEPNNESIYDTIKDLHGYAAILHAYAKSQGLDK